MNRDYSNKIDDEIYFNLSLSMSRGTDGADGINTLHSILSQFIFDNVNLLVHPTLDPKRNFIHEEKLILYRRAQGCCQLEHNGKVCGRPIDFDDAVVDHIIPHSKNGLTILDNGRISDNSQFVDLEPQAVFARRTVLLKKTLFQQRADEPIHRSLGQSTARLISLTPSRGTRWENRFKICKARSTD